MNAKRISILIVLQLVAAAGIWLATWGVATWPSRQLYDLTTSELINQVTRTSAGIPVAATLGGVAVVLLAFAALAITFFRFRD
ncbi:MAG: hypothetical protein AAF750_13755 [Planctomycetota bacterium]